MKDNKVSTICSYIASVCFYISALIYIIVDKNASMGVIYLCLGSMWLCLASVWNNKKDDNKDTGLTENVELTDNKETTED